jgi:hypothetical protein
LLDGKHIKMDGRLTGLVDRDSSPDYEVGGCSASEDHNTVRIIVNTT